MSDFRFCDLREFRRIWCEFRRIYTKFCQNRTKSQNLSAKIAESTLDSAKISHTFRRICRIL
ncbi:hypothetical protein [Helicobacter sp. 23-1045]